MPWGMQAVTLHHICAGQQLDMVAKHTLLRNLYATLLPSTQLLKVTHQCVQIYCSATAAKMSSWLL